MNTHLPFPTFSDLTEAISSKETPFIAAQAHGYLCGIICATHGKVDNAWQAKLLGNKISKEQRALLQQLFETSLHLISEFSFEFALILPEDRADLNLRTEALGTWCQGFLTGLEQYHIKIENRPPSDLTDTLNDLLEIAQVNFGDIQNNEEDETAYFELVEYVRLAVLMIFHEIHNKDEISCSLPT